MNTLFNQPITAETYLIAEYERIKTENAELKAQLEEQQAGSIGVLSITNEVVECIKVSTYIYRSSLFDSKCCKLGDLNVSSLEELLTMDYEALFDYGCSCNRGYYSAPFSVETRTFAGYVEYKEFDGTKRAWIDPRDMNNMYIAHDEPYLDEFILSAHYEATKKLACEELRDAIRAEIEKRKEDETEQPDESESCDE